MEDSRLKADHDGSKVRHGREPAPDCRIERDLLGTMRIPSGDLRGIHTFRALDNFYVSGRPTHLELIRAYALVKKACAMANAETGWLDADIADAIAQAADEAVNALDREISRSYWVTTQADSCSGARESAAVDSAGGGRPIQDTLQNAVGAVSPHIDAADFYLDALQGGVGTVPAPITAENFYLDALQGGAGTSTNMNVNEVLANRATEILRADKGVSGGKARYTDTACGTEPNDTGEFSSGSGHCKGPPSPLPRVEALSHLNLHQSTNDTYPTALRVALIAKVRESAEAAAALQGAFQAKEREFAQVVTVGRTEMRGAVPMTLGAIFSGFAEAAGRDRWRTFKCEERLRVVNLGGTAVGTGLTAPRKYIFRATEILRGLTGFPLARAENLVDATANADALAEVAGIISARGANLTKAARDLRQLATFADIELPAMQAGSSIMPGKVNPVILEAVMQAGMKARSECALATEAVGEGTLQINEFLPLIADSLLSAIDLTTNASTMLARHVAGISAHENACAAAVNDNPIIATALLPMLGYAGVETLVKEWGAERGAGGSGVQAEEPLALHPGDIAAAGMTVQAIVQSAPPVLRRVNVDRNSGEKPAGDTESFRDWLSRRLGAELVDRVLSPAALSALGHGEKPEENS